MLKFAYMSPKKVYINPMTSPLEKAKINSIEIPNLNNNQRNEAKTEGSRDAVKETTKEEAKNQQKLDELLEKTTKVIYKAKNIIPILTDELVIDTVKVSVIHRLFFFSERIHSVSIRDITDVYIETVPFFATINIVDKDFIENKVRIAWISKKNAERARRIITGLMQASKEQIDLKIIEDDKLAEKLEEIGKIRETVTSVSNA